MASKGVVMKRCLIIDDSDVIRKVARHILERLSYDVSEAESGQDGFDRCKAKMPDVILLDWLLPDMKAVEFLSALRLSAGGKRPFVIYCPTEYDPADISRAFAAGADDYLMKPFDRKSLVAKFGEASVLA
jgi:two-component system chemotaxis response regulator CheY